MGLGPRARRRGGADGTAAAVGDLPVITLENSSGGGWTLGTDVDQLAAIAGGLEGAGIDRRRVGFCLDTAHLWGAGIDVADPTAIDELLAAFDRRDRARPAAADPPQRHEGRPRLADGSARASRCRADRAGRAGPPASAPAARDATYILETPGMEDGYDAINIARAVALARGEPLVPLPPGALTLRGSRARAATPRRDADGRPRRPRRRRP